MLPRLVCLAALAFAFPAQAEGPDLAALVVAPDRTVDGFPLADHADAWWQWAFSMPDSISPTVDEVGTHCAVGQEGPVWFLAGGYGSSKIRRACQVPADR